MTDKVQKIREEVERRFIENKLNYKAGDETELHRMVEDKAIITFIDSLQEEPVSDIIFEGANFNKSWYAHPELAFEAGAKWQKEHNWKPADGDDLPEYEREVVVFTQNFPNDAGIMSVAIAHRPDPKGWDGKSISTGEVEHYTPQTYGNGDWNIPDVKYWLDVELPKEIEP